MKEQFDKRLVEKIKDSFQNHEEAFNPQEWEKLSATYFKNNKTRTINPWFYWAIGIAASVVLAIIILPIQNSTHEKEVAVLEDPKIEQNKKNDFEKDKIIENEDKQITALDQRSSLKPNKNTADASSKNTASKEIWRKPIQTPPPTDVPKLPMSDDKIEIGNFAVPDLTHDNKTPYLAHDGMDLKMAATDSIQNAMEQEKALATILDWMKEGKGLEESQKEIAKNENPMRLGVMFSPQTISNATQPLNFGAGIMTEFSFSKRLKIDVGLAYAKQNLTPEISSNGNLNVAEGLMQDARIAGNYLNETNELSFGQLEIPINLKYKLLERKATDLYLISGISNMVYLNQQNERTFNAANFSTSSFMGNQQQVQTFTDVSTPESGPRTVESGRMLNFAIGYEYTLSNSTFIAVEPFYKLSVGSQTFIDQQFSMGGINLRMNFLFKK